jgi:hypothetical protein
LVQIFFSEPCSQTPSVYALPLMWETTFNVSQQWFQFTLLQQCTVKITLGLGGCLVPREGATDRQGQAHKMLLAQARARRTPKMFDNPLCVFFLIILLFKISSTHCSLFSFHT